MMKLYKKYLTEQRRRPGDEDELEWGTTVDGWNDKQIDMDTGLIEWIAEVERMAYELRNARRDSYAKFGREPRDLQRHIVGLSKDLSRIARDMKGYIGR